MIEDIRLAGDVTFEYLKTYDKDYVCVAEGITLIPKNKFKTFCKYDYGVMFGNSVRGPRIILGSEESISFCKNTFSETRQEMDEEERLEIERGERRMLRELKKKYPIKRGKVKDDN